jgi:hypothetical protein
MGKMPDARGDPGRGNHQIFLQETLEIRELHFRQGVQKTLLNDQ